MNIRTEWNEKALKNIAKKANSYQAVKDVSYSAFLFFHNDSNKYIEWIDGVGFIIGCYQKKCFRIIGMATAQEYKGQGIASHFLYRLIRDLYSKGIKKIRTKTLTGAKFYSLNGFVVTGQKDGCYLMELNL